MNKILCTFAREYLKQGLNLLPVDNQFIFIKMYSPRNLKSDINDVVDRMSDDKLDWAMQQVERSLQLLGIKHNNITILK